MIVGLSGYAQSGKDTAASFFEGYERRAFADPMRDVLYKLNPWVASDMNIQEAIETLGWDKAKVQYPEIRRLLQVLGTEVGREMWGNGFWIDQATKGLVGYKDVVFTDVRFPNEYETIKMLGGVVIRIVRDGVDAVNAHPSESALDDHTFDFTIKNNGTKAGLKSEIEGLMKTLKFAEPYMTQARFNTNRTWASGGGAVITNCSCNKLY